MAQAPDHAGQREPPEPGRRARPQISGRADGKALLRRRRRPGHGLRAATGISRGHVHDGAPHGRRFSLQGAFKPPHLTVLHFTASEAYLAASTMAPVTSGKAAAPVARSNRPIW